MRQNLRSLFPGEQMVLACVVPTMEYGGRGVTAFGGFAGDTAGDLTRNLSLRRPAVAHQPLLFKHRGTIICLSAGQ